MDNCTIYIRGKTYFVARSNDIDNSIKYRYRGIINNIEQISIKNNIYTYLFKPLSINNSKQ